MSQMRNENRQLALPRVRLPRDAVSEEETPTQGMIAKNYSSSSILVIDIIIYVENLFCLVELAKPSL